MGAMSNRSSRSSRCEIFVVAVGERRGIEFSAILPLLIDTEPTSGTRSREDSAKSNPARLTVISGTVWASCAFIHWLSAMQQSWLLQGPTGTGQVRVWALTISSRPWHCPSGSANCARTPASSFWPTWATGLASKHRNRRLRASPRNCAGLRRRKADRDADSERPVLALRPPVGDVHGREMAGCTGIPAGITGGREADPGSMHPPREFGGGRSGPEQRL